MKIRIFKKWKSTGQDGVKNIFSGKESLDAKSRLFYPPLKKSHVNYFCFLVSGYIPMKNVRKFKSVKMKKS
jgi:hypothetical protein